MPGGKNQQQGPDIPYHPRNSGLPGVPKDLHEKIFRPNFTTKKKGLSFGLGLGLTIVRRIVDSYGGRIRLESVPGHTVFTIIIPTINNHGKN